MCYVGFWCSAKATSIKATLPVEAANEIHTSNFPLSPSPSLPLSLPSLLSLLSLPPPSLPPPSLPSPPPLPPSLPPSLPLHQPGFDVNATSMNGCNALHYAADYGQVEVVQLLLEKKANIDVSNIHRVHVHVYIIQVLVSTT